MKKQLPTAIGGALGMLILILDGRTALAGMRAGVEICLRVLVPALFPFFVLSGLLTAALSGSSLPLLRPLGRWLGIPSGCEYLMAIGALGGYPVGARNVALAYENGDLTRDQAARILPLCNNAGPSFLFGMLAPLFSDLRAPWLLWLVQLLSVLLVGLSLPGEGGAGSPHRPAAAASLPLALKNAIASMALVCGWVILFRLLLAFLDRWLLWALPEPLGIFLAGLLELSNGCIRLAGITAGELRFLLASLFLAFGGICVNLQTVSVCGGIPCGPYFRGKLLQAGYAVFLSLGLLQHWAFLIPALLMPPILRQFSKNRSSISPAIGV